MANENRPAFRLTASRLRLSISLVSANLSGENISRILNGTQYSSSFRVSSLQSLDLISVLPYAPEIRMV